MFGLYISCSLLAQFIIWPFGKLFFGLLANNCDATE
jgi:hypothetical protein